MFRQIITPESKADLIIHLPNEFIGKKIEVEANEMKDTSKKKKDRRKELKESFDFFSTISIDMSSFKFSREEANER